MSRSLILGLIAASVFGVIVAFADILLLNQSHASISKRLDADQSDHLQLVRLRDDLRYEVVQVQQFLTDVSATRAQNGLGDGFEEAQHHARAFNEKMRSAIALSSSLDQGQMLSALQGVQSAFPGYYATGERMARAYVAGGPASGNALMPQFDASAEGLDEKLQKLDVAFQTYEAGLKANATTATKSAEVQGVLGLVAIVIVGAINIAIGFAVLNLLNRRLLSPVSRAIFALKRLTEGDYSVAVDGGAGKDEIGDMARAVRAFRDASIERIRLEGETAAAHQAAEAQRLEVEQQRLEQELRRQQALQSEAAAASLAAENARQELQAQYAQTEQERLKNEALTREASEAQALVVSTLANALESLAKGDLTVSINQAMPAEYRKLKEDFNGAVAKLRGAMEHVTTKVSRIHGGVTEIASATDELSRRTEHQAASLEETAAALSEITSAISSTANSAKETADIVGLAQDAAKASGDVVKRAILAMSEIESSSTQINQIISVIDEIAFQTNLLALNAGVEAARAGDAGRGFAVVASEVGALAQRSAQSAKEIKALISASTSRVGEGSALVTNAGDSLLMIVDHVMKISAAAEAISKSAHAQSSTLRELSAAVTQMDRGTQQNAAMVEETMAATRALSDDADELTRLVKVFRVHQRETRSLLKTA